MKDEKIIKGRIERKDIVDDAWGIENRRLQRGEMRIPGKDIRIPERDGAGPKRFDGEEPQRIEVAGQVSIGKEGIRARIFLEKERYETP